MDKSRLVLVKEPKIPIHLLESGFFYYLKL